MQPCVAPFHDNFHASLSYSTNSLSQEPSNTNGKIHAIAIFLIVFGFHFVTYW